MIMAQNSRWPGFGKPVEPMEPSAPGEGRLRICCGYTLVEVLVAVLVLSTIGLAYYGALSSGFGLVQSTREDLRATQVMVQKVETIRLCTWSQLTNFTFQESYDPVSTNGGGTVYFGSVTITPANSLSNNPSYKNNMCQVNVNLNWTNYNGSRVLPHSRQMQTQVARYGLQNYVWGKM